MGIPPKTIQERIDVIKRLREQGVNPYPSTVTRTHTIDEARNAGNKTTVAVVGRLRSLRGHGKIIFGDLNDESGNIQIVFKSDILSPEHFKLLKSIDEGDFLAVEGTVGKTEAGELSVFAGSITIVSKTIAPLPDRWFGLKDVEERYRKRYLDLLMNPEVKQRLDARWKIEKYVRMFLWKERYVEVETPVLQPLYGGTNAKPFTTHMNALDSDFYLRVAPELYLKRLMVGGYERVFEIARNFRNEGIDHTHQPEFTMIEWYEAYADYLRIMNMTEELIKYLAKEVNGTLTLQVGDHAVDLSQPWKRLTIDDAMKEYAGIDWEKISDEQIQKTLKEQSIAVPGVYSRNKALFRIYEHTVTKQLIEPTWVIDYPQEVSPLSKSHRSKPGRVERFEGYIAGKEIFDGWSEIVSSIEQRERFENEQKNMKAGDDEAQPLDEDFLAALSYGCPPLGGIGIGIDRLTMLLTNTWAIKEIIAFPTLKPLQRIKAAASKKPVEKSPSAGVTALSVPDTLSIDPEVAKHLSSVSVGVALIKGAKIQKTHPDLEKEKKQVVESLQGMTTEQLGEYPEIKSYRKLYKEMGVDWHSRRPSPEALLRRIALGKGLYTINTCVDAYNLVVMKHRISVGAFDADHITFPTVLRFACEGDEILLLGDDTPTKYTAKELAYYDQDGGYNIDFNYRDAKRTCVTEKTTDILINVDGIYDISPENVQEVLDEAVRMIVHYCGGTVEFSGVVSAGFARGPLASLQGDPLKKMKREEAIELLHAHMQNANLRRHCYAVETVMRALARHFGEDEDVWGIAGLLHDADYEETKEITQEHSHHVVSWLKEKHADERIINAILAHAWKFVEVNPEPSNEMEWSLYCCDELTGFIVAVALIKGKSLANVTVESVLKKFPVTGFAAGVHRPQIKLCEEKLGIKLEDFVGIALKAMQDIHEDLGL